MVTLHECDICGAISTEESENYIPASITLHDWEGDTLHLQLCHFCAKRIVNYMKKMEMPYIDEGDLDG